jgi:D-alanyl-D-alanine carboxypeptidase
MSQLPLSAHIKNSFPKNLKATCFIISNIETGIVLHEKNSKRKIHSGTFNNIVFVASVSKSENLTPQSLNDVRQLAGDINISEVMNNYAAKSGATDSNFFGLSRYVEKSKTTLYDMCCIFENSYKTIKTRQLFRNDIRGIEICFFKSAMSGVGCAFSIKNKNGARFACILYGLLSEKDALNDAKLIAKWLDQFFIFQSAKKGDFIAEVPVFYGKQRQIKLEINEDHFLLMSEKYSTKIRKTERYVAKIAAPVKIGDDLGRIFYLTEVFENPVTKRINSRQSIMKGGKLQAITDTFYYVIFGTTVPTKPIEKDQD